MYRLLCLVLITGCQTKVLEEENAKLKQRVADLDRAATRLEAENKTLKEQMGAAARAEAEAKKRSMFADLGLTEGKKLHATIQTSMGDIDCVLREDQAPETVLNFVQLARGDKEWTDLEGKATTRPLYDGTIFHRVMPEFMIQGGDPRGNGTGGPGYQFADEVGSFTTFDKPGLLAMANSGPDSNGSQFFITEGTPDHLNGKHTIFGDCSDLDLVKKIARVPATKTRPDEPVVIKHIDIVAR